MEVFYFKLYCGDDIIAELVTEDESFVYIAQPFRFIYTENSRGRLSTSLTQWIPIDGVMAKTITLSKDDVIIGTPVDSTVKEHYSYLVGERVMVTPKLDDTSESKYKKILMCSNSPSNYIH